MVIIVFASLLLLLSVIFALNWFYFTKEKKRNSAVSAILFHSVTDIHSPDQSHTTVTIFSSFLEEITARGYETIVASEVSNVLESRGGCPNDDFHLEPAQTKRVAIIFDDGFESFFFYAFPELQKFGLRASIFPVAGYLGKFSTWDIYHPQRHLNAMQVRYIADAGHEIGSHTLTHPDLRYLSWKALVRELTDSRKILEDCIGKAVTTLSFPFGGWNRMVWQCAGECGYTHAAAYRNLDNIKNGMILPVTGVYRFDTVTDILEKVEYRRPWSLVHTRDTLMPHFAQGTPIWKFKEDYSIWNLLRPTTPENHRMQ